MPHKVQDKFSMKLLWLKLGFGAWECITSVTNIEVCVCVFALMCTLDKDLALNRSDAKLGLGSKGRAIRGALRGRGR